MLSKNPLDQLIKPQKAFKKRLRDNKVDSTAEFYTPEYKAEIENRIRSIPLQDFMFEDPVTLKPYVDQSFIIIDTEEQLKEVIANDIKLSKSLGVDVEQSNKSSYQGYVCLIQISTEKYDYIIDAIALHDVIQENLSPIFADPAICKIFFSGRSDLKWLNRDFGIFVVNYFDLQYAFGLLHSKEDMSLVTLLNKYCGLNLEKQEKKNLQVSDWRIRPLAKDQLNYAAADSHYLRYLRAKLMTELRATFKDDLKRFEAFFSKMQKECLDTYKLKEFTAIKLSKYFAKEIDHILKEKNLVNEKNLTVLQRDALLDTFLNIVELADEYAREIDVHPQEICDKKLVLEVLIDLVVISTQDKGFSNHLKYFYERVNKDPLFDLFYEKYNDQIQKILQGTQRKVYDIKQMIMTKSKATERKLERKKKYDSLQSNAQRGYENCCMLKPNGELLSYCDRDKIDFYLKKELAVLVPDQKYTTIRLLFEPVETKNANDAFLSEKFSKVARVNQCMVCGHTQSYSKFSIMPDLYRAFLPDRFKAHRAHDFVLMCWRCGGKYLEESTKYRNKISLRYGISEQEPNDKIKLNREFLSIKNMIVAYKQKGDTIPNDSLITIKKSMQKTFSEILEDPNLTEEGKKRLMELKFDEQKVVVVDEQFEKLFVEEYVAKNFITEFGGNKLKQNMVGKKVVDTFKTEAEIFQFITEWKDFFMSSMNPQFIAPEWVEAFEYERKLGFETETEKTEAKNGDKHDTETVNAK